MKSTRSIAWGLAFVSLLIWFGPAYAQVWEHGDTPVYMNYARAMFNGLLPWKDIAIEYPPLALPLFLIPYFFGRAQENYLFAFMTLMALVNAGVVVATVTAVAHAGRARMEQVAAGAIVAAAPVLIGTGIALSRYDLWPTLLVVLAMLAMFRGKNRWAAGLLAAGAAAKIWPGLMMLPVLALAYRRGGRRELIGAATTAALVAGIPFAIALAIGGEGFVSFFAYHLQRPLQIESFGSALLVALWRFLGIGGPFHEAVSFGSFNLEGPGVSVVATATGAFSLSLILLANFLGTRRVMTANDDKEAVHAAVGFGFAAVLALMAFGKVMSPQFLLWLVPMPFLLGRRRWATAGVLVVMLGLTGVFFLDYYRYVRELDPLWTAILFVRNLVLGGLTIAMLFRLEARGQPVVAD